MMRANSNKQSKYIEIPCHLLERIKPEGRIAIYKKGSYIFRDKDETESIFILIEGKAIIYKLNDSGHKRTIFILDGCCLLNEPASVCLSLSANCVAFEKCNALIIDRRRFIDLMAKDFELTTFVINQLSHKVRRMYRQLKNANASTKIEKKVAAKLWKLCLDYGVQTGNGVLIDIEITNNQLADLMGVRRETVSRALKTLQDEGLVVFERRRFIVFDPDNLAKYFKSL